MKNQSFNRNLTVDLLQNNKIQTDRNNTVQCKFELSQSQPILDDTTNFELSVTRFNIQTIGLPVFIPTMKSLNETIYVISLEKNGIFYSESVVFFPQNLNPSEPDEYYYIYNYCFFINLLNQTLITLCNRIGVTALPKFNYDPVTKLISLNIDSEIFGYNENNKVNIFINSALNTLLNSLPITSIFLSKDCDYQINNSIVINPSILSQEFMSVYNWSPISNITFTSNLLPVFPVTDSKVQIYENGNLIDDSTDYNFSNTITDFIANNSEFLPFIQYSPSIYRYIALKQNQSIRSIDISVSWKNKFNGNLTPLYLAPGTTSSCKLYFKYLD